MGRARGLMCSQLFAGSDGSSRSKKKSRSDARIKNVEKVREGDLTFDDTETGVSRTEHEWRWSAPEWRCEWRRPRRYRVGRGLDSIASGCGIRRQHDRFGLAS